VLEASLHGQITHQRWSSTAVSRLGPEVSATGRIAVTSATAWGATERRLGQHRRECPICRDPEHGAKANANKNDLQLRMIHIRILAGRQERYTSPVGCAADACRAVAWSRRRDHGENFSLTVSAAAPHPCRAIV
jgi:hypothetical protein